MVLILWQTSKPFPGRDKEIDQFSRLSREENGVDDFPSTTDRTATDNGGNHLLLAIPEIVSGNLSFQFKYYSKSLFWFII